MDVYQLVWGLTLVVLGAFFFMRNARQKGYVFFELRSDEIGDILKDNIVILSLTLFFCGLILAGNARY